MITPFEYFCGGRSLECFFMDDLMEEPELMHEIFDMVLESNLKTYRQQIIDTHAVGVWIGGWRSGPDLVSPDMIDEFVWPAFEAYYNLCIEMNVLPIFHLDSNWTLALDKFKRFEDKTYVMALDSKQISARQENSRQRCVYPGRCSMRTDDLRHAGGSKGIMSQSCWMTSVPGV